MPKKINYAIIKKPPHTLRKTELRFPDYVIIRCVKCDKEVGFSRFSTNGFECNSCFAKHMDNEVDFLKNMVHRLRSRHVTDVDS